jgi:tetratricopeptide (TPR) repeat protein
VELEIDNLRAAFEWSRENSEIELAARIASSLQPLWLNGGRIREGLAWFSSILSEQTATDLKTTPTVHARALTDKAMLDAWAGVSASMDQPQQALQIAREVDDPALLTRALTACGFIAGNTENPRVAWQYFTEATALARALDDKWMLSRILLWQAQAACVAGDPTTARAAAEEVRDLGDAIGHRSSWRDWRGNLGWAQLMQGDLAGAVAHFRALVAEADTAHDPIWKVAGLQGLGFALAYQGAATAAQAAADAAIEDAAEFGEYVLGLGYSTLAVAALAAGDVAAAQNAGQAAWQHLGVQPATAVTTCAHVDGAAAGRPSTVPPHPRIARLPGLSADPNTRRCHPLLLTPPHIVACLLPVGAKQVWRSCLRFE